MANNLSRGLPEQIARQLGTSIVSGDIGPGDQLSNEDRLGEEFGVSRTVIREAMKRLGAKGLVEIRPRLGTRVLPRNRWNVLDPDVLEWQREAQPSLEVLLQFRDLRVIVEPGAAALAATRASKNAVDRIMAAYERMEANVADAAAFAAADVEFHTEILQSTGNEYLDALGALISADLMSSIKVTNPGDEQRRLALKFHRDVAEAIAVGDEDGASTAMRTLLGDARQRLQKLGGKKSSK